MIENTNNCVERESISHTKMNRENDRDWGTVELKSISPNRLQVVPFLSLCDAPGSSVLEHACDAWVGDGESSALWMFKRDNRCLLCRACTRPMRNGNRGGMMLSKQSGTAHRVSAALCCRDVFYCLECVQKTENPNSIR